ETPLTRRTTRSVRVTVPFPGPPRPPPLVPRAPSDPGIPPRRCTSARKLRSRHTVPLEHADAHARLRPPHAPRLVLVCPARPRHAPACGAGELDRPRSAALGEAHAGVAPGRPAVAARQ